MPWKETSAVNERIKLISEYLEGQWSITDLSRAYGVSRKSIYKWIRRFETDSIDGIKERSRAPLSHPNAIGPEITEMIIQEKLRHQNWGPKKIVVRLQTLFPDLQWPVASTAGEILKRHGLVKRRRIRRRTPSYTEPFLECQDSNAVWSADFKGQFQTGDGKTCYPFTLTDNFSRYLLACRGLRRPSSSATQPWLEWAFREYGLPRAIKTDNGAPFASVALGGLSTLSVWLVKLGIRPERIDIGHPEQNGRHERMHRTLKAETTRPPKQNLQGQQQAFDKFVREYNEIRPHESLGQKPPASFYESSSVAYPSKLPEVTYDSTYYVRQVRHNGEIRWKNNLIYASQVLAGEPVGLREVDDGLWQVFFSFHPLGILDERTLKITPFKEKV
jgi:transposase InsO family protein